jgi:DNA-directed RNA polymerase specialized sigma24 family protein
MAQTDIERLYDEHAQAVFAYLLNFTRHEADTRDLLQELFIKLAEHAPSCSKRRATSGPSCSGWRITWLST